MTPRCEQRTEFPPLKANQVGAKGVKMRHVNITALLACFILAILLNGCAYNAFMPYRSFEHIEINTPDFKTSIEPVPTSGESTATGAAAGAFGGLAASFFTSLICGPYFAVCFAATAPATIVVTRFDWGMNKPQPQHSTRTFRCSTRLRPIDEWAEDDGVTIERELNDCLVKSRSGSYGLPQGRHRYPRTKTLPVYNTCFYFFK